MIKTPSEIFNLIDPDAALVKDSPCNICGKKSTARLRLYDENGLNLVAACDDHLLDLKEIVDKL